MVVDCGLGNDVDVDDFFHSEEDVDIACVLENIDLCYKILLSRYPDLFQ
jgi:hypothetical protein